MKFPTLSQLSPDCRYIFFYKPERMTFVKSYLYNDSTDVFQFEPFVVHFNTSSMGPLTDFVVIPLHAKPSAAETETDALVDVYDDMVARWGIFGEKNLLLGFVTTTTELDCKWSETNSIAIISFQLRRYKTILLIFVHQFVSFCCHKFFF